MFMNKNQTYTIPVRLEQESYDTYRDFEINRLANLLNKYRPENIEEAGKLRDRHNVKLDNSDLGELYVQFVDSTL